MEELQRRKLPRELKQSMEGLLTIEELTEAVMVSMNGSSSPGCDGFTVNHLREFCYDLCHITQGALNASFGNELTSSLRLAIIKLLRKGQKDPTLPGNCRPISLLSIFYKLASACITNRMKPAVQHIIGKEQKAYTPEKNMEAAS